tara:strand:- start:67 stop:738 length:672 start_codon:yes stop_codon:yes gene_type:complete
LAKRLTEKQIKEIIKHFISGINIDELSEKFNCTKLTISRKLKSNLGEKKYKEIAVKSKLKNKKKQRIGNLNKNVNEISINTSKNIDLKEIRNEKKEEEFYNMSEFIEIEPLNYDIENSPQKDLSSVPISDINFPKTVFMIVDNKVELDIKFLKDYPRWQFLSTDELKRKTIEIYFDLKIAKSFCGKEQKVIKVPNTDVFKIVAPILRSRGISRIVSSDKLIAL